MKAISVVVSAALMSCLVFAASSQEAQASAEAWLSLVDNQKYAESWAESSSMFQSRVAQQKWMEMSKSVREPLGQVTARKLLTVTFAKSLPGAPDGDYAVLRFQSSFKNKADAVETVTLVLDGGKMKSAGYFIN